MNSKKTTAISLQQTNLESRLLMQEKKFRKQLIDNIVKHAYDHMSLLTAAILIKKKFTVAEIIENYYTNLDVFGGNWY